MRLLSFVALAAYLAVASASVSPLNGRAMVVHETVKAIPRGFAHAGSVAPSQEVTLRIALAHTDITALEKVTYDISNPASANYGQHLTAEKIAEYVKPPAETLSAVNAWLDSHGISAKSVSAAGDILQITVPVKTANSLLAADFVQFQHIESGKKSVRTLKYSVPAELQSSIKFIHPTVAFVPPLKGIPGVTAINHVPETKREEFVELQGRAVPSSCASIVTPACVQALYGVPATKSNHSATGNTLGVSGYIDQFANSNDLALFLRNLNPTFSGSTFSTSLIDGGQNTQTTSQAGIEADLDVEYTVGIAGGVPVTFISVGDQTIDDISGFVDITNFILSLPVATRPTVLTTSYGFNEPDLPIELNVEMCNAYMQLGAAGVSVLFASGDGGVGGVQTTECTSFVPTAPGGCPFITSVGGVTGVPPQTAASLSGGGFSNHFATPDFQLGDVQSYLAGIGDQYAGLYNATGRGLPDVAASAESVEIAWQGSFWLVDGTSCASPIFASIISLVNDRLLAAGKPVLGFLNPFLYSPAGRAAFTDVTTGTNPGCNTNGFSAKAGWDPVTGLGTPNFNLLLAAAGL
ncbi:Serine protease S53 [Mycena indigotica]|uniref:tripeptidyl-peptidase II n=1 Tax=Mycena indigotica TaxID=2126181 RepID=A0A8H6SRR6_9AGAR|nr:Serine protease S53 [Mycena indigotica]KAF7304219.1 Serine protease S53 [Mycena indigotica]